ncbi:MAG: two-component regulator propeller domain-containing protein, partial [Bacteroidota bacterium]
MHTSLKAQEELNFRSFAKQEGLSQSTVFAIAQDSIGYMWFGTRNGLNRFDGLEMKIYQHDPEDSLSLPENEIRSLFFDKVSNALLIGTEKGLAKYDHKANSFIRYRLTEGGQTPEDMTIHAIIRDSGKNLWIASGNGLFFQRFGSAHFQNIQHNGQNIETWSLLEDENDSLWIGSDKGILRAVPSEKGSPSIQSPVDFNPYFQELSSLRIGAMKTDQQGNLWLGTETNGLYLWKVDSAILRHFPIAKNKKTAISYEAVRAINMDSQGNIWVGTRQGLNIIDPIYHEVKQSFFEKSRSESISDNSIRSIFFDSNTSVWVGTYYGGVNYSNPNLSRFIHFESELGKNSLSYPVVSSFCELGNGQFLIGTEGGGINKFNRNTLRFSNEINEAIPELAELNIKCMVRQSDTVWMGTYAYGLIMYNLVTGKHKLFRHDTQDETSIPSNNVYGLVLQGDQLWIGTFEGGLSRMDTKSGKFSSWQNQKGDSMSLSDNRIRSIIHDRSGKLWIGTDNGLNLIQSAEVHSNQFKIFLSGKRINTIRQSQSGNIWVGTYRHGIFLLNPEGEVLERYGIQDGLPSLSIFGIIEDGYHAAWFSTNHGIAKLDLRDKSITAYNNSDGLKTLEFNFNAHHKSETKEIYFGSTKGFTIFDPQKIKLNTFVSPLAFNFLKLGNKEIQVNGPDNLLSQSINYTREINLPFDQANFTLSFAALDFQNPEHNYFSYKLDGIDKDWNIQRGISSVSYTLQKEGTYVFNLKVANSDGIWNPRIKKLRINVLPPFWRTKWAYFFYFILFCLSAFVLYRILRLQRKLRYEEIEKKHQKALNESKLRFFTDITHEFRTPLTLILGPLEDLINGRVERSQEKLKSIHKNTQRLLTLINQLMDFRRLDKEHYSLKRENIELNSFLNEMWTSFRGMADEKQIDFQLHTPEAPVLLSVDREKLEKVYFNILSNAFKFTPPGGQILIETVQENGWVSSKIKNTGEKINAEHRERIFERFFESNDKSTSSIKGSGIGLSLSKKLIELHGGRLYLAHIPKWEGACFTIDLP